MCFLDLRQHFAWGGGGGGGGVRELEARDSSGSPRKF